MGSFLSDYQINQIVGKLLKASPAEVDSIIDSFDLHTCDKDAIRESLMMASMNRASRKIAVSTFFIDFIFDAFLLFSLVVLGIIGWPIPLCTGILLACIITQIVRPLNYFTWFFGIFYILAFIMQLINFGFFYWYTPMFFISVVLFTIISPLLQKHIVNKIMSNVYKPE